jgi:phosphinothricin acetyltransferase
MIRFVTPSDPIAIAEIYNYYILNTTITFEVEPVSPEEIAGRIGKYSQIGPYLVYEDKGEVIGYAYVSRFRERKAYEHTVESTIYLRNGSGGKGVGFELYSELLSQVSPKYHAITAGIALPNDASIRLHEKCGFKKIGRFSEVGRKFGKWIDVGFWQKVKMFDMTVDP